MEETKHNGEINVKLLDDHCGGRGNDDDVLVDTSEDTKIETKEEKEQEKEKNERKFYEPVTIRSLYYTTSYVVIIKQNDSSNVNTVGGMDIGKHDGHSSFDLNQALFLFQYHDQEDNQNWFTIKSLATGELISVDTTDTYYSPLCVYTTAQDQKNKDENKHDHKDKKKDSINNVNSVKIRTAPECLFQMKEIENEKKENKKQQEATKFSIKNQNTGHYLCCHSSDTLQCNRTQVKDKEPWEIRHAMVVKIHVYGLNKCPICYTVIEVDGKIYQWDTDSKVTIYDQENNVNTVPLFTTKLCKLSVIYKLMSDDFGLKDRIIKEVNDIVDEWNSESIKYHYKHNNTNNFTLHVLTKLFPNFGEQFLATNATVNHFLYSNWESIRHSGKSWWVNDYNRYHENFHDIVLCLVVSRKELLQFVTKEKMKNIYVDDVSMIDIIHDYASKYYRGPKKLQMLAQLSVDIPIQIRSIFNVLSSGYIVQGTMGIGLILLLSKMGINKDVAVKMFIGLAFIIPQFIKHIFDSKKVSQFVSDEVFEIHSFICVLMALYSIFTMLVSWNKYQWIHSLCFAFVLFMLSIIYYILFYVYNVWICLFSLISIPIAMIHLNKVQKIVEIPPQQTLSEMYDNNSLEQKIANQLKQTTTTEEKDEQSISTNVSKTTSNNTKNKPLLAKSKRHRSWSNVSTSSSISGIDENNLYQNSGDIKHFEQIEKGLVIAQVVDDLHKIRKDQKLRQKIATVLMLFLMLCYIVKIIARVNYSYGVWKNFISNFLGTLTQIKLEL